MLTRIIKMKAPNTEPSEAAAPAAEARPAHHDRGEDLQQHRVADQRIAAAGLGADEHARQPVAARPPCT